MDDLDLAIEAGSFYALLGPSGCGKTTTLRMIGGFEQPTSGVVRLGGEDISERPPHQRDVNTVFQSYALFPHLDVQANVEFGLARKGVERSERRQRAAEALALAQLTGFEKRKPTQLSGGQQQRVALARALVNRPRALLLDEPLGALDLRLRRQLQVELKRIQQEVGITFVHVTHDQEEAMSMADEIAVMNRGRIEQRGGAVELYEQPRTAFVARFLGTSNLISGARSGSDSFVAASGERLQVPPPNGTAEGVVCAGVRPEKITLVRDGVPAPEGAVNLLTGQLTVASFLGTAVQYIVQTPAGEELTVVEQNRGTTGPAPAIGAQVQLAWRPEHTFVVREDPADV